MFRFNTAGDTGIASAAIGAFSYGWIGRRMMEKFRINTS